MKRFSVFPYSIWSLDFKVLTVVGLVILAMAVGSLFLFKRLADQAQSLLFDAMDAMSVAVHHGLGTQIHERYYDVHAFAKNPALQAMNPDDITQVLDVFVQLYGIYDLILVTDPDGRYVSSNSVGPTGEVLSRAPLQAYDFSQDSWFQAVRQSGSYVDNPALDPYLKMMDGRTQVTNTFATAIIDDAGRIHGMICMRAGVRWIQKELDQAYGMFHAGGFSVARIELINANGESMVEAGAPLSTRNAMERPARYPGTADRSRASKIWSIVQSDKGDLMVGSSFLQELPFAPGLDWSIRLTVGSSSASRQLTETVRMSYAWILLAAVGLMFLTVAYLRRLVLSRHLQQQVAIRTAELHQTTLNLEEQNRELERHKRELVATNRQLIEAERELLDTAKRLGQSEVAALTLHNIGNIITSLNIQSTLLREQLDRDAPGKLTMAYLKKIEVEGRFPEGLALMRGRLEAAEQDAIVHMQNIMRGLVDNVRMAMAAISSQLAFVQQRECAEPYKLSELLQHTLILYFGTFKRHRVRQIMKIQEDAMFLTERFLFESILTVLIRNAIDATSDQEERSIMFATELDNEGLSLLIQDNGHGFGVEVGSQIFRFGFSTKARGHGFGLHYAANSCRHLGLELSLDSPGPGQGAIARLRIPRERIISVMEFVDVSQGGEGKRDDQADQTGPSNAQSNGIHGA